MPKAPALSVKDLRSLLLRRPVDAAAWTAVMGPDCHLRVGNDRPAIGGTAAAAALAGLLARVDGFGHEFCQVWRWREYLHAETDIAFRGPFGRPAAIPCAVSARVVGGLLRDLRFYFDPAPLPLARPPGAPRPVKLH